MKEAFTICIEDGCNIIGLQVAVAVQRECDNEKSVSLFSLSKDFKDNDKWLFKIVGCAERIEGMAMAESEAVHSVNNGNIYVCSCGYGWDKSKVVRHHFCPNCGAKMIEPTGSEGSEE